MARRFGAEVLVLSCLLCACSTSSSPGQSQSDGSTGNSLVFLDAGPSVPVSPDGPSSCPAGCNYQTQQGCDSGQMCHPQLNGDTVSPACVTAGMLGVGESCVWQQCMAGLFCGSDMRCHHLCCGGDWSVCASNESCTFAILLQGAEPGSSPVPAGVSVCEPTDDCDVFDPESCPSGKSCYIVDSRAGTRCLTTGTAAFNGSCSATKLCAAGLTCAQSIDGRGSNCRRLCRAVPGGGQPSCPDSEGVGCAHFVRDPPGVGECTPI